MSRANLRLAIAVLTAITAVIHLFLGIGDLGNTLGILFLLNGLAYLALLAAFWFDIPQGQGRLVQWALIAFAAVTIVAYFAVNDAPLNSVFGLVTKVDELLLIIATYMHMQRP